MTFPLSLSDMNILLGVVALLLLVTSTLVSSYHGKVRILVSKKRLSGVAAVVAILFLVTVAVKMMDVILGQ
jgi:phage-related holin